MTVSANCNNTAGDQENSTFPVVAESEVDNQSAVLNQTETSSTEKGHTPEAGLLEEKGNNDSSTAAPSDTSTACGEPEADQRRTAKVLTTKLMGSLAVAYVIICLILALKKGPIITF